MTSAVRTFLQLGRNGDIINILPALRGEFMRTGQPTNLVVDVSYAPLLDGCSYVNVIASPYQDFAGVQQAARWARRIGYNPLTITQVHGRGWSIERSAPCFAEDSRRLCQVPDTDWREPVIFDKRSPEREQRLIDRLPEGPIVLFNGASRSAPFSDMESFRDELRILCESNGATVFDITDTKAERLYDLLGLYERAALLVTVDTATLHLASATPSLPVISLLPGREDKWHFAWMPLPTVNVALAVPYPKWKGMMDEILDVVCEATGKTTPNPRVASQSIINNREVPRVSAFNERRKGSEPNNLLSGYGLDLWPRSEDALGVPKVTVFSANNFQNVRIGDVFPPVTFDYVHCSNPSAYSLSKLSDWMSVLKQGGRVIIAFDEQDLIVTKFDPPIARPRICVMTGSDNSKDFVKMANMCERTILRYCRRYAGMTPRRVVLENSDGKFSWGKVPHIRQALLEFDYVLWIDADALIVGDTDIAPMLGSHTLYIASDTNGINCGVMAWRSCPESFSALDRIYDQYERLKDHQWFEQAALMEFIGELDVYQMVKSFFNAYPDDVAADSLILHWPGMSAEERIPLMREVLSRTKSKT